MKSWSVKQLSELAGISVRTLHLYDEMDLLKPSQRTEANYRMYGEEELLKLQQILFYRELGFSLREIRDILEDQAFDFIGALEKHKLAIEEKKEGLELMLKTIDRTINQLKEKKMLTHEELYEGLPKEAADSYRKEAIEKYGKDAVEHSENSLRKLNKEELKTLFAKQAGVVNALYELINEKPGIGKVQDLIAEHYQNTRILWGTAGSDDKQAEAYAGLGDLYVNDERFALVNGKYDKDFAMFMRDAMKYFAEKELN